MVFEGPDGFVAGCEDWAALWAPKRPLSVSAWAGKYRRLSGKTAAEPGPWRNDRIPYLAAIMDALDARHPAPLVVFKKSAQVGGSECALNWVGRTIHQQPASFLFLTPSEKDSRKWVRTRANPMIAETPELRRIVPLGRKSDGGSTLQEKHYPGGVLFTGSANIPSDVAAISVPYVILDDADRFPPVIEDEGDPVELAKRRTANFVRRKVFEISTPTTEELSRVHADWLTSTQDRYFVPCPDCAHLQYLRFEQLQWPEGRPDLARYACEACGVLIEERSKTEFLARGEWRAQFPEREAEVKGFHINALYTPIGLGETWPQHAAAWDRARGNPGKEQVFTNTRLGEVVKSGKERVEWAAIHSRREPLRLREIPPGVLVLTAGVDLQADRVEAQILGHGRGESIAVVDYHVMPGDPTRDEIWKTLDDYLAGEMLNSFGVRMRVQAAAIDSGNWQHEVTNFTRTRKSRNIFAAKGSSIASRQPIGKPTMVDVNWRGQTWKRGAEQYQIGVSMLKTVLYRRIQADAKALPADRHIRFPDELPEEYFRQLAAEVFDPRKGWTKVHDRNEALDTFVLAMAASLHHSVQIHRNREIDWLRLEQLYEPKAPAKADPNAKPEFKLPHGGLMPTGAIVKGRS
jgi:phage terminase large subunit GpA-like protein